MTSPKLLFCLTVFFLQKDAEMTDLFSCVHQDRGFISANAGSSVTLECFSKGDAVARFFWYMQSLGQKPRLMSTFYMSQKNFVFYDEWKNNPRFTLDSENGRSHLIISDLHISDSATYYCACSISITFEFAEGTLVSVKGSGFNVPALVYQSASETIQLGGSATLNCTAHTGTCDGEHIVYWFKNSEESHPGLIYTHGGRNDQCERERNTETNTCVYNLPLRSLNRSHAGTYYCAVVSCGHILFGNGTKLDFKDDSLVLVHLLTGALTFTTILSIVLAFTLLIYRKQKSCQCRESSASSRTDAEGYNNEDNLHYAALKVNKTSWSRRQRDDTEAECVYSRVKQ
uniref:uncharacterized protein n=1 Tax=Semicossyphus pulcher TaxID=241346 RepID=UPI0037E8CD6A